MSVKIKQRDVSDCGAACIASIASYYKLEVSVSKIRQLASTDKKGTNIQGLLEALGKIGFDAKGVRGDYDSLHKIPKPAIAHVIVHQNFHHYVVIYGATSKGIEIMDPADGQMHHQHHEEFQKSWTGVLVILTPSDDFKPGNEKKSALSRLNSLIIPHRQAMIQATIGALLYTLLGLASAIYVQKIVDHVIPDGNRNLLNLMSTAMVLVLAVQMFIGVMKSIFILKTGQLIDLRLILGYFKHLLKLPQQFFDTMRVGEILSRVNDAVKIRVFVNEALAGIIVNVLVLIFSFALMFSFYWKLAAIMTLIMPFYGVIFIVTNYFNKKVERSLMERSAELESQMVESLTAIQTIRGFNLGDTAALKMEVRFTALLKKVYKSGLNTIFSGASMEFVSQVFIIVLLWKGAGFALDQEITAGELLSFYTVVGHFTGPVSELLVTNKVFQNAQIAADRLFEIIDLDKESEIPRPESKIAGLHSIRFVNAGFRYGARSSVFENLSLEIPAGRVTALVGESGSGKSTLVGILQRFYPLNAGHIFIGDMDLAYLSERSIRSHIGVVPQKIDLFAGNVIENVAPGEFHPDFERIVSICKELGMLEFIEAMPQGFSTYLGENGATLSGGQKQRLALARVLYRDPEIIILDEATSSLDSIAEGYVKKSIEILKSRRKTIIVIAHRLSTIRHADKIIVLENGRATEEGTHEELLLQKGHYHRLWVNQSGTPAVPQRVVENC